MQTAQGTRRFLADSFLARLCNDCFESLAHERASTERPFARAAAASFDSSCGSSGKVTVIENVFIMRALGKTADSAPLTPPEFSARNCN